MTIHPTLEERLAQMAVDGLVAAAVNIGTRLGIFIALAELGSPEKPATAEAIAHATNCKPRYVEELLCLLATADIIEVNKDEHFWIKHDNIHTLTSQNTGTMFTGHLPLFLKGFNQLVEVFKNGGPLGLEYSDFGEFYDWMTSFSELIHKKHLIDDFIPHLDCFLDTKLKHGAINVLDVGCGGGFHASLMAEHYPLSNFTGIDVTPTAIEKANKRTKSNGSKFDNLEFIEMDAGKMDESWENKFDVVCIFDACHDQMRPDLCLKEIHRVLKPDGVFGMLEVIGSSNVYEDKKLGQVATMFYAASMYHCLPVGSNSPDALGLGAMWGKETAMKMLKEAGFSKVEQNDTPQFAINQLYVCRK